MWCSLALFSFVIGDDGGLEDVPFLWAWGGSLEAMIFYSLFGCGVLWRSSALLLEMIEASRMSPF